MERVSFSAVIPTYREGRVIADSIEAVAKVLDRMGESFEILIVDNASPDNTVDIARQSAENFPVRVLVNPRNLGKGYSVRRGMLASRGDWRFFCDADLSTPVREIERFGLLTQGEFPILVGSRLATGANVTRLQPMNRLLAGRVFLTTTHLLFPSLPHDVYCGFKWFRADAADRLFGIARARGWVFDLEVLAIAANLGMQALEVPIEWENHSDTRLNMSRDWLRIAFELARIRLRTSRPIPESGSILPPRAKGLH